MNLRGFALFLLLMGQLLLATLAFSQQDQPSSSAPPAQTSSVPAASSQNADGSPHSAPGAEAKPADNPKLDLTPDASGNLSQEQMQQLLRVVAQNYRDNYKKLHDYTYIERDVERKLDVNGSVKATETRTYEMLQLYGEPVARLIQKDDKPLSDKEATKEDDRIQKIIDKRKNESEDERQKREAEREKARERGREFVSEVADAYNFRLVGSEIFNGRDTWVVAGEPRGEFRARLKEAQMLSKFHGQLWIDKSEMQLAKMDIEAIDTASIGWVLARIRKGTRIVYEQTRVNDEVWLPQHFEARLDMRIALFKRYNEQEEGSYRDYQKFRTSAKIVGVGEVQEQK